MILSGPYALAQADSSNAYQTNPSYLSIERSRDDADNQDTYLSLDLPIFSRHRISLYASRGESASTDTKSHGISFSTDPYEPYSLTLSHERHQQQDAMDIRSNMGLISLNDDNWSLSLGLDLREIEMALSPQTQLLHPNAPAPIINGQGKSINWSYYGWHNWSLSLYRRTDNYDRRLEALDLSPLWAQRLFAQASLDAAWSLTSKQTGVTVNRYFQSSYVSINWNKSIAVIDSSEYRYLSILAGFDLSDHWSLELEWGQGQSEDDDSPNRWRGAGLTYRW